MSSPLHTEPRFNDDDAARDHLEALRWPLGAVCPHCGGADRQSKLNGEAHRPGLYFCGHCRSQYTVTVGTVLERSKVPLHKWVYATHLLCASKKGISAKQLERMLGVTYKTAWFMAHRIREAMTIEPTGPLGGSGMPVEVDETCWGNEVEKAPGARGGDHKMKIVSLVERDGTKRSFHIPDVTAKTIKPIMQAQIDAKSRLMTDESRIYTRIGREFASHETVNHSAEEYARGDVTTNTVESSFSLLKRSLTGTFHAVSQQHLQRYINEFDFRWNTRQKPGFDECARAEEVLKNMSGKRLTYRSLDC